MIKHVVPAILAAFAFAAPASAAVTNIGFEQGLTGWTTVGDVIADNSLAHNGSFSALLSAQVPHNSAPSSLSQVFSLKSGETITFYAQFTVVQRGNNGFDTASLSITPTGQSGTTASWAVPANNGTGQWQTISFTAPSEGLYQFRAEVDNVQNSAGISTLRIDGVAAAPEPATWALMLLGFAGLGVMGWRRGRKAIVTAA
jgi:hypothetical protein